MTAEDFVEIIIPDNEPTLTVNQNSITLSCYLVREINVKTGDRIKILRNIRTGDIYIKKTDENGLKLKSRNKAMTRLAIYSKKMSKMILGNDRTGKYICEKYNIDNEPIFLIFTRKNLLCHEKK